MKKKLVRMKRALKTRSKIKSLNIKRLTVHKSLKHIYAQIISEDGTRTLVSASTKNLDSAEDIKNSDNIFAAEKVGKKIAERALELGISEVAFDRSGYKYHGRIKALAEAARSNGLKF